MKTYPIPVIQSAWRRIKRPSVRTLFLLQILQRSGLHPVRQGEMIRNVKWAKPEPVIV